MRICFCLWIFHSIDFDETTVNCCAADCTRMGRAYDLPKFKIEFSVTLKTFSNNIACGQSVRPCVNRDAIWVWVLSLSGICAFEWNCSNFVHARRMLAVLLSLIPIVAWLARSRSPANPSRMSSFCSGNGNGNRVPQPDRKRRWILSRWFHHSRLAGVWYILRFSLLFGKRVGRDNKEYNTWKHETTLDGELTMSLLVVSPYRVSSTTPFTSKMPKNGEEKKRIEICGGMMLATWRAQTKYARVFNRCSITRHATVYTSRTSVSKIII